MTDGISVTIGYGQVSSWLNKWDDLKQDQGGIEDVFAAEGIDNRVIRHRLLRFFEDCWHLVDWVKADDELPDINEEVETEALDDDAMRVCRAVALVSKHHTLRTTARTPEREKAYVKDITFSSGRPSVRVEFVHGANDFERDAETLVRECMSWWHEFFKRHNIVAP